MTDRELMQQALVALEFFWDNGYRNIAMKQKATMDALRERLAQPEQEPIAWVYQEGLEALKSGRPWTAYGSNGYSRIPLYLNAQWQGLTDEEIVAVYGDDLKYRDGDYLRYSRAIEAKLKEKNT
jgi:hypothetical protein